MEQWYPNLAHIEDPEIRDSHRLLWDQIYGLRSQLLEASRAAGVSVRRVLQITDDDQTPPPPPGS